MRRRAAATPEALDANLSAVIAGFDPAIHLLGKEHFFDGCAGQARA
jgi:hypothetical protein